MEGEAETVKGFGSVAGALHAEEREEIADRGSRTLLRCSESPDFRRPEAICQWGRVSIS